MEDTTPPPEPPACLKDAGSRFWVDLFAEYEFPGSPEMVMLVEEAAKTADVVARLQRIVDEAPMLRTRGSRGQDVAIPELDALRAFRVSSPLWCASSICRGANPRTKTTTDKGR